MIKAPWAEGAIGTSQYTRVSLKHLQFFGADMYFEQGDVMNYAVNVPW